MSQGGGWLVPLDQHGRPRLHKPPLYTWLGALAFEITGPRLATLRGISIGAGVLAGWALYLLAGVLFRSRAAALLAGAMMLSFTEFNLNCGQARPDSLLIFLIIAANYCLARVVLGSPHPRRFALLGFLAAGLAFLAKGPYGLLHTLPVPFLAAALRPELRPNLGPLLNPLGWLILPAVAGSWYAVLVVVRGPEVWPLLVGDVARNGPGGQVLATVLGNIVVFLRDGLVTSLPWWPLLLLLPFLYRGRGSGPEERQERTGLVFAGLWAALALLTLLPNKSNYIRYLLVILPGLGLIASQILAEPERLPGWARKGALPVFIGVQGLIYLAWAGYLGVAWYLHGASLSDPRHLLLPWALLIAGLVVFMLAQWRRGRLIWTVAALACLSIAANGIYARDFDSKSSRAAVGDLAAEVLTGYSPRRTRIYDLAAAGGDWPLVLEKSGHHLKGRFQWTGERVVWPEEGPWEAAREGEEVLFLATARKLKRYPLRFRQRFETLDRRSYSYLVTGRGGALESRTETALLLRLKKERD